MKIRMKVDKFKPQDNPKDLEAISARTLLGVTYIRGEAYAFSREKPRDSSVVYRNGYAN